MKKIFLLFIFIFSTLLLSCDQEVALKPTLLVSQKALNDSTSIYYADFSAYNTERATLDIGIVSSDENGAFFLDYLIGSDNYNNITGRYENDNIPDFAGESFQLISDMAHSPYFEYISYNKRVLLREQVIKNALFLMEDNYHHLASDRLALGEKKPVKMILLACELSSIYALNDLQDFVDASGTNVEIISVLDEGIKAVAKTTKFDQMNTIVYAAPLELTSSADFKNYINKALSKSLPTTPTDVQFYTVDDNIAYSILSLVEEHRVSANPNPINSIVLTGSKYIPELDSLNAIIQELKSFTRNGEPIYRKCISNNFSFIIPEEHAATEAYSRLRKDKLLKFSIYDTSKSEFVTIPTFDPSATNITPSGSIDDYRFIIPEASEKISYKTIKQ